MLDFNIRQIPMDVIVAIQTKASQIYAEGSQMSNGQFAANEQANQSMQNAGEGQ